MKKRSIERVVTKTGLRGKNADAGYWRSLSYADRLAALETIRDEYNRWRYTDAERRFQREFFECLNSRKVRYLLIGGYAVAFHGYPRYTKDIDVWIEPTDENAANLLLALDDFGFGDLKISKADVLESGTVIQIGYPPNRIDLLSSPDGVDFAQCFENLVETEIDGLRVRIIGLEDLRRNKTASGRLQDLADLENLGS